MTALYKEMAPHLEVPSAVTLLRDLDKMVPRMHSHIAKVWKTTRANMTIMLDGWTKRSRAETYLGVLAYWVSSSSSGFKAHRYFLDLIPRRTLVKSADWMATVVQVSVQQKLGMDEDEFKKYARYLVSDSAADMRATGHALRVTSVPCAVHQFDLIMKEVAVRQCVCVCVMLSFCVCCDFHHGCQSELIEGRCAVLFDTINWFRISSKRMWLLKVTHAACIAARDREAQQQWRDDLNGDLRAAQADKTNSDYSARTGTDDLEDLKVEEYLKSLVEDKEAHDEELTTEVRVRLQVLRSLRLKTVSRNYCGCH